MQSWIARLKNEKDVIIRFLTLDDEKKLIEMFSSMSDETLQWGMPPYTKEVINRWFVNIHHSIPLITEFKSKIIGCSD